MTKVEENREKPEIKPGKLPQLGEKPQKPKKTNTNRTGKELHGDPRIKENTAVKAKEETNTGPGSYHR